LKTSRDFSALSFGSADSKRSRNFFVEDEDVRPMKEVLNHFGQLKPLSIGKQELKFLYSRTKGSSKDAHELFKWLKDSNWGCFKYQIKSYTNIEVIMRIILNIFEKCKSEATAKKTAVVP
jgi:hypothetical protein